MVVGCIPAERGCIPVTVSTTPAHPLEAPGYYRGSPVVYYAYAPASLPASFSHVCDRGHGPARDSERARGQVRS